MDIVNITDKNINLLVAFLENKLPSTFRYFSKRSVDCIKTHILTVIGTIHSLPIAYGHIDKDETGVCWLGLCILDNYQSYGYGTYMIKYLIENANNNAIYLTVDDSNIKAISLYNKFGFVIVSKFDTYYKMCLKNIVYNNIECLNYQSQLARR